MKQPLTAQRIKCELECLLFGHAEGFEGGRNFFTKKGPKDIADIPRFDALPPASML